MNLIELIPFLKTRANAEKFISEVLPDVEFDQVEIYLREKLDINSEIKFVDAEAMDGRIEQEIGGVMYTNLFPLWMLQEMVEDYPNAKGNRLSDIEIATRMINYGINDA